MGKTKTKYPIDITIQFLHPTFKDTYDEKIVILTMNSTPLTYANIKKVYDQFLEEFDINTPAFMELLSNDGREEIMQNFQI